MTRLRKCIISLLCLVLAGCGSASEAVAAASPTPTPTAAPATPTPLTADFHTVASAMEQIGGYAAQYDWNSISSLFAEDASQERSASDLEALWKNAAGEEAPAFLSACSSVNDGINAGYALMQCGSSMYYIVCRMNDDLEILRLMVEKVQDIPQTEKSDDWEETAVEIGNDPKVAGILTMPVKGSYPYIAVLMPEQLDDAMDESGDDPSFRKDLAHALAERGIASIRYDMRLYEDPSIVLSVDELSLDRVLWRDFANAVHSLEKYPVDAQKGIVYIGHGIGGSFGYSAIYHHFEIIGGFVLLNAPYGSGTELMAEYYGLDESIAEEAQAALDANAESDAVETVGGYPLSWWQDFEDAEPLKYTRYVAQPIAIFQGQEDEQTTLDDDYENWKSQKGSNVSMVSYSDTGHDMRDEDGSFDTLADDISSWLDGEDLEEIVTKREKKKAKEKAKAKATATATPASRSKS